MTSKLQNTEKTSKSYWFLLKIFLNNQKIPLKSPVIHSNRFISDFKHKAEPFNDFFSNQCSLINNTNFQQISITLPIGDYRRLRFQLMILLKLFKTFNSNKANGHDNISISMLRIGGDTIKKYLELFFKAGPYHRHISF